MANQYTASGISVISHSDPCNIHVTTNSENIAMTTLTRSTSHNHDPILHKGTKQTLEVKNLHFEVDEKGMEWWQRLASFQMPWKWCQKKNETSKREILKDINFSIKSGHMLAVLGSSGSGKTSLLDAISCQTSTGNVTGDILINGEKSTPDLIKETSAYVRQNDRLLPHLTVKETLMFVAQLKLPKSWSYDQIQTRVESVIAELGLRHVSDSKVGGVEVRGISGGERRRVSIGIQLLLNPGILFLDEPTSGLDSFTAHHLVETLSKLASNGRIVMITIHQPRSDIFELFDQIMLLSQGNTVYNGRADNMVDYFTYIGYPCPQFTNPCDFYVDLTTVDMKTDETESTTRERVDELVKLYEQDQIRKHQFNADIASDPPAYEPNSHYNNVQQKNKPTSINKVIKQTENDNLAEKTECTYFGDSPTPSLHEGVINNAFEADVQSINESESAKSAYSGLTSINNHSHRVDLPGDLHHAYNDSSESVGRFEQFTILFRRALSNNLEDYGFLGVQALEALFMSLMIGLVFYGLNMDQISVRDRFGLLYIIGALYPYMVILDVIGQYHRERNILYFEMLDGLYTPTPYFFSKLLSEIPEHTIFIILYATPVYFLTGLQQDPSLFFEYFAIIYATVYCSRSLALFAGAFLPTYQISVLFAQSIFTVMLMSCGFIFNLENIFVGVKWTSYVSYLKWGNQGLCNTEFPGLNFTCEIPNPESCIWTGEQALTVYSLDGADVWACAVAISLECIGFLTFFFLCVRFLSQQPHEQ